jgi:hypothetical protein
MDESKFIVTFNTPGSAEFGTQGRNVTPAQLLALAYALEHHTVKINPVNENESPAESALEVTFESPGSARCTIIKRGVVELLQVGALVLWLDWHAQQFFTAGARQAARAALEKKPESQILVPSLVIKQ